MAGGFVGAENPVRFLDAFVGMLCCRDNINNDRGLFCRDDLGHRKSAMQRFGCNYLQNKGLEKVRTEWRFTPKAFGADNPGLQPQTSLKSGELRETDGSGRSKSPAKSLNRGGGPFFHSLVR